MNLLDTHLRLADPRFPPAELPQLVERARAAGVGGALVVGHSLDASRRAIQVVGGGRRRVVQFSHIERERAKATKARKAQEGSGPRSRARPGPASSPFFRAFAPFALSRKTSSEN
jgi:hypothetical protein